MSYDKEYKVNIVLNTDNIELKVCDDHIFAVITQKGIKKTTSE